ncbi:MAG: autotransporter assembly complex family protein [Nitrospirota bacterium]
MIPLLCVLLLLCMSPSVESAQVEVVINGLEGDVLENAKSALAVPSNILEEGRINKLWLEYFKNQADEKVRTALEPFGYYNPQISSTLDTIDNENYTLRVKIDAGEPVRVKDVHVSVLGYGANDVSLKELVSKFPLKKGDTLLQGEYEKAKWELKAQALEKGYLDADFSAHSILLNRSEKSAQIELVLETGPRYRFGKTSFEGASEYPVRFLERYLAYKTGETISSVKVRQTQHNLINSERFSEVILNPEKEKTEDLQVPVIIRMKPGPSRRFRIGIGYGTDTGARFSMNYSDLNSLQSGYEFKSELSLSERLQGVGISYRIPSYKDLNSYTEFKANAQHEDVDTYTTRILSLEANHTKSFGKGRLGTIYLRLQQEDSDIADEKEKAFLVLPGVRFSVNRYNNLMRPTSGYLYAAEVRGTHEYLGSDTGFLQLILQGSTIVSLPWRLSLYTRINGAVTAQEDSIRHIPASLRFFTGGDQSIRGYKYQSLGPKNEKGDVIGGKHLLVGSVELERALFSDWGVAAFYDAGNSFNSFSDIKLYEGAGIGLRYYTQIGAIRLDIARQIDVSNPTFRIHFSLGIEL